MPHPRERLPVHTPPYVFVRGKSIGIGNDSAGIAAYRERVTGLSHGPAKKITCVYDWDWNEMTQKIVFRCPACGYKTCIGTSLSLDEHTGTCIKCGEEMDVEYTEESPGER